MDARRGPRDFDPAAVARAEAAAWTAYYRHEWRAFLRAAVGMVSEAFGMSRPATLRGAYHVLRANQLWAPVPDNDPAGARDQMRRFYALVSRSGGLSLDPARAAELEVAWWRAHREHQYGDDTRREELVGALTDLYSYVYGAPRDVVRPAAEARVRAMDHSDAWVAAGHELPDPRVEEVARALRHSYAALLTAVSEGRSSG